MESASLYVGNARMSARMEIDGGDEEGKEREEGEEPNRVPRVDESGGSNVVVSYLRMVVNRTTVGDVIINQSGNLSTLLQYEYDNLHRAPGALLLPWLLMRSPQCNQVFVVHCVVDVPCSTHKT